MNWIFTAMFPLVITAASVIEFPVEYLSSLLFTDLMVLPWIGISANVSPAKYHEQKEKNNTLFILMIVKY